MDVFAGICHIGDPFESIPFLHLAHFADGLRSATQVSYICDHHDDGPSAHRIQGTPLSSHVMQARERQSNTIPNISTHCLVLSGTDCGSQARVLIADMKSDKVDSRAVT